jgi:putative phosphoesterase
MTSTPGRTLIGLISDTHGMLRPAVHKAFEGVDLILHAGDVGGADILDELRLIAPVQAVYGNTDPPGDPNLEESLVVRHNGVDVHVSHGHELGNPTPSRLLAAYPQRVLVYGHTHKQLVTRVEERLVINPGAAGARRFKLQPSVARLSLENGNAEVEIVALD